MSETIVTSPQMLRRTLGLWLLPPLAVGLGLRWVGLRAQVLTGDELHSVHGALEMPISEILRSWTFGGADYCVPITALYRLLMDQGVVFSEMTFRLPSLFAGLAVIALLPWLAAPRLGQRASSVFAWLLAVSPMLVFYSRIIRSYMPAVLAVGVALLLFDRWLRGRHPGAALGYVGAGALAVYLHLGTAPLVIAPLAYAFLRAATQADRLAQWRALIWPALGLALCVAALLFPAQESLLEVLRAKRDGELPSLTTWIGVLRLQLGTREWVIALLLLAVLGRGVLVLWRTQRDFLAYLATLMATQIIGLMLLSPDRLQERAILNRYLLVALPLLLIPMAAGLAASWRRGALDSISAKDLPDAPRDWSPLAITSIALLAWFGSGPLAPTSNFWTSSFSHTLTSVDFLGDGNWVPETVTPRFYRSLAGEAEGGTALIEYPWQNLSSHAFDAYQRTHGLAVIVASVLDRSAEARLSLRNRAEPTPQGFLASRARYLVVHKNLRQEAGKVVSSDPHHGQWLKAKEQLWEPLRRAAKLLSAKLERKWGAPSYEDSWIRVWNLDRVRASTRSGVDT